MMEPLVKDDHALVWRSHDIPITLTQAADEQAGKSFGCEHELFGLLNFGSSFFFSVLLIVLKMWFLFAGREHRFCTCLCSFPGMGIT